ncbi:MFS general substrate transporter [Thozetella sp. PMI_491]|nr:MFS general substrate transporter [Thozetella sp. PMI_491]
MPSEKNDQIQQNEYPSTISRVLITISITLATFLLMLDISIIGTATPRITDEFHSLQDVGWYGSAYQFAAAAPQLLTGKIYHRFSTKWTFLTFIFIFELGSLLCASASSSRMLIIGRAVAGLGSAGLLNGAFTIVSCITRPAQRASITSIVLGISQFGIAVGPLIGGAFTEYSTWRWCFYINLPVGGLGLIAMAFLRIPDQVEKPAVWSVLSRLHRELDFIGFLLSALFAIQLLLGLQYGSREYSWDSSVVIGLFCGTGVAFVAWVIWNWRQGDDALLPFSMAKRRLVWASGLSSFWILTTVTVQAYFLPIYFQAANGTTPFMSGVYYLPTILSQLLMVLSTGFLVQKTGHIALYILLSGIVLSVGFGLLSTLSPTSTAGQWIGYQILVGAGRGIGIQMASPRRRYDKTPVVCIQTSIKPAQISMALSLIMYLQSLGGAIFLTVGNTIFDETLKSELAIRVPNRNPNTILELGATHFRNVVTDAELPAVIASYTEAIDNVFYLVTAIACLVALTAVFLSRGRITRKKQV